MCFSQVPELFSELCSICATLSCSLFYCYEETVTKATCKRKCVFGANSFTGLEFVTIVSGSMVAGGQAGMALEQY